MDKIYYITLKMDFYGELLTQKQRDIMARYYFDDYSLNEIAEEYEITRQAVQDMIKRTEKLLDKYEEKLLLVEKFMKRKDRLNQATKMIDDLIEKGNDELIQVKDLVSSILD